MIISATLAALLALSAPPARAQDNPDFTIDHQEWHVIGWNDACGAALTVLSFPKLGEAIAGDPISTRAGTLIIPVAKQDAELNWTLQADGPLSFSQKDLDKAEKDLKLAGFSRAGYPETLQDVPVGDQPLLADAILSTETLKPRLKKGWPGPEWRWAGASYNPLGTCGLLVYENRQDPRHYSFLLLRVYNARARTDRAYAHASNARLLFNSGNLDAGAMEAETAALLAPDLPIARYEHAAMLALTGHTDLAMDELNAAVKLDPKYRAKARDDEDFDELRRREDFKEATRRP
ncbi:MAG: tetratricopeptide repeat protein [Elusimicrobiota bacterium]